MCSSDEVFVNNIRPVLGNGKMIDLWVGEVSLKESFPRIFSLAIKKTGKVEEIGVCINGRWQWYIQLRREVFVWEEFLDVLYQFSVRT
ncbi:hypothetical protein V6N11_065731 [Hibiscus sabdariffa]|uniref:Uncharacterized protein n=1 Tax=Hibiscus sabdariffa TaxID=183260 RepID=A0ABR2PI62_9ROSI